MSDEQPEKDKKKKTRVFIRNHVSGLAARKKLSRSSDQLSGALDKLVAGVDDITSAADPPEAIDMIC